MAFSVELLIGETGSLVIECCLTYCLPIGPNSEKNFQTKVAFI